MQLIVENALLSAGDGLVQSGNKIWFHFQKYPWHLSNPEKNPVAGKHRRLIEARLSQGFIDPSNASLLNGTYHLGISPHCHSPNWFDKKSCRSPCGMCLRLSSGTPISIF